MGILKIIARHNTLIPIVNTVGIPTCIQHLSTWFVRRPDDGPVRAETCSLTHNKTWCVWCKLFFYFNKWTFNISGCLQSKTNAELFHKLSHSYMDLKFLYNLARYLLQAPWGWHDSVETCRSVIICEIIVHLLVIVQN
jgi:hypothetical protein